MPRCHDQIEDEKHVLLDCPLYADLRERLFNEVKRSNVHFIILSDDDKLYIYLKVLSVMIWLTRPALIF